MRNQQLNAKTQQRTIHKAQGAVAASFVRTGHINSQQNPSDILIKANLPLDDNNVTGLILHNQTNDTS